MIILALDQSVTRSGYAVIETEGRRPRILDSGSFSAQGATERDKVDAFAAQVTRLVLTNDPVMLVWEKPAKYIPDYGGRGVNAHQLILTRLDEQLEEMVKRHGGIGHRVASNTWRAKVLGRGAGSLGRQEAKRRAVSYCQWIDHPVDNADEAEACCIGLWAATCAAPAGHNIKQGSKAP